MESFNYNAPNCTDFTALSDSDDEENEKYFDIDHEFNCSESAESSVDRSNASNDVKEAMVVTKNTQDVSCCKRKRGDMSSQQPNKYVCMAEAIEKFQRTTPARFHTKPRHMKFEFKGKKLSSHLKTTVPMSPHLQVLNRNRPTTALSRWQIEDMEVEEMKNHKIKARPVNENIFKPIKFNVSHQSHVTEVKPFNLTECKRKIPEEPHPRVIKFTAQPIPKGLFDKKENRQNVSAPNVPIRHRVPVSKKDEGTENKITKKPVKTGPTHPSPFSFEDRDKLRNKKKEEFINQILEEEKKAREFHANPLPKFSSKRSQISNWSITSTNTTVPQPFRLSSVDRAQTIREKWEKKIEEEKKLQKQAAEFKAKPAVVLSQKPFIPKKPEHHVEVVDIKLSTETRAQKRALLLMERKEREEEIERMRMERKKRLEQKEEEEVAEMRRKMVHKANPIRNYKGIAIHASDKPLTSPQSPHTFARKNSSFIRGNFTQ